MAHERARRLDGARSAHSGSDNSESLRSDRALSGFSPGLEQARLADPSSRQRTTFIADGGAARNSDGPPATDPGGRAPDHVLRFVLRVPCRIDCRRDSADSSYMSQGALVKRTCPISSRPARRRRGRSSSSMSSRSADVAGIGALLRLEQQGGAPGADCPNTCGSRSRRSRARMLMRIGHLERARCEPDGSTDHASLGPVRCRRSPSPPCWRSSLCRDPQPRDPRGDEVPPSGGRRASWPSPSFRMPAARPRHRAAAARPSNLL